jgi:purine-binding chemotaxis protein CheW
MKGQPTSLATHAEALRQSFDRSFAEPVGAVAAAQEGLLAIRIGAERCALRLSEIGGVFVDKKVMAVPGSVPALLGVSGFRGAVIPVYNLHALLGHAAPETLRWLVTVAGASIALAFERYEGHMRVAPEAFFKRNADDRATTIDEFVRAPDSIRTIIRLTSLLDVIRGFTRDDISTKDI